MALLGDMISLEKKDGRVVDGIRARVHANEIVFNATVPPLEAGDTLLLGLPGGGTEACLVLEADRHPGRIGRRFGEGFHYRARVRRSAGPSD